MEGPVCIHDSFLNNTGGTEWLYVEHLNGDLRWIHRNRLVEIKEPYWMDLERYTLVTRLNHPSTSAEPLRKGAINEAVRAGHTSPDSVNPSTPITRRSC